MSMDIVAFIEEYFGIQLLTYQKLQLRMLMMEYAKYEGKARPMIEILKFRNLTNTTASFTYPPDFNNFSILLSTSSRVRPPTCIFPNIGKLISPSASTKCPCI